MILFDENIDENSRLSVEIISDNTFRIHIFDRYGKRDGGLNRYGFIKELPCPEKFEKEIVDDILFVKTKNGLLKVNTKTGEFSLSDNNKTLLKTEKPISQFRGKFTASMRYNENIAIYGLGDVTRERVEKNGFSTEMWVENVKEYIPIPFLNTNDGWGMFLNTTWRHNFDIGKEEKEVLTVSALGGGFDAYFFIGDSTEKLLNEYTNLLGKPIMLPKFAYGLVYVCNQNVNDKEMIQECLNFRREDIPCDVCGLEPGWMSKYYDFSTKKSWNGDKFYLPYWPTGKQQTFFGALDRLGFKLSLWLCCDYDLSTEEERLFKTEKEKKQDNSIDSDNFEQDKHFETKATDSEKWFSHLEKFVDQGVECFKLDGANQIVAHPTRKWANGMDDEEMHNLYPLIYNKQMSKGFSDYTGRRSMIYSSGGYAGIQNFSASWAGDTGGGPKPLVSMLNHAYSGHVNTSCDMDIFSNEGIHFGFFQPWSQLCNWAYWRQPWLLEPERECIYRFYAKLRYRMLPYIYTLAHRACETGYPIMRDMRMEFDGFESAEKENILQYMFGDDILTSAFQKEIELPSGKWFDGWTGKEVEGGKTVVANYPQDRGGPLFIRENAVIPTADISRNIGNSQQEKIEFNIYPTGKTRKYELYDDDGTTYAYKNGEFALTKFEMTEDEEHKKLTLRIDRREGSYCGIPKTRKYKINVMNRSSVKGITVDGEDCENFEIAHNGWCGEVEKGFISFEMTEKEPFTEAVLFFD